MTVGEQAEGGGHAVRARFRVTQLAQPFVINFVAHPEAGSGDDVQREAECEAALQEDVDASVPSLFLDGGDAHRSGDGRLLLRPAGLVRRRRGDRAR